MNDCVWAWVCACDFESCCCDAYCSINTARGADLADQYDKEVAVALEPIKAKYKAMFEKEEQYENNALF
jgi:hypothetical protein